MLLELVPVERLVVCERVGSSNLSSGIYKIKQNKMAVIVDSMHLLVSPDTISLYGLVSFCIYDVLVYIVKRSVSVHQFSVSLEYVKVIWFRYQNDGE